MDEQGNKYNIIASEESISKTILALKENNFIPYHVKTKEEALSKVKELIPSGASVMNGASETLRQIGFIDYLKSGKHSWDNLHEAILAESDPKKQGLLRRLSVVSDFYVGSVHAMSETGELVIASNTGSQLPHLVFTSPNLVLVVGAQKIMPSTTEAIKRLEEYVIPLEDKRMIDVYGFGTTYSKTLIYHRENPMMGRKFHIIIVDEKLGF